jgi:hypothetical protein
MYNIYTYEKILQEKQEKEKEKLKQQHFERKRKSIVLFKIIYYINKYLL